MRALGGAIKWILALSILFELWVAIFVQEPVAPNFTDYGDDAPMAFYWSRGLLFHGGPIEGIVASRNLLGMVALLGLIVFGVAARGRQRAARAGHRLARRRRHRPAPHAIGDRDPRRA